MHLVETFTGAILTLSTDNEIEEELHQQVASPEYKNKGIHCLGMGIVDTKRSSVIIHLQSDDGGNVKLMVEKGIVNGDLTSFIMNLLNDENIKKSMTTDKKYNLSVSLHAKDQQKEAFSGIYSRQLSNVFDTQDMLLNFSLFHN